MNLFKKIRGAIKRKMPATFNAAEYEAEKIIAFIGEREEEKDAKILMLQDRLDNVEIILRQVPQILENNLCSLKVLEDLQRDLLGLKEETQSLYKQGEQKTTKYMETVLNEFGELHKKQTEKIQSDVLLLDKNLAHLNKDIENRMNEFSRFVAELNEKAMRADLNAVASCKSDDDFDCRLIPLNRYFDNRGMAIAMHLTSVAEKPAPIVYETADIIRTSALSLVADEINDRKISGSVAELGVAKGKFARVINAMFPDRDLHLFDTFDDFPEVDIAVEHKNNYSEARRGSYTNIDLSELLGNMPYPERCIVHKGYFPNTAVGLEAEFCFVNIDCDLYKPIADGLAYFYPRLVKGGCIFVHDYRSKYFTGVKVALREFTETNDISYCVLPDNTGTAVIMK